MLSKSPFELSEAFLALEYASIFSGDKFTHDLLFETALSVIPSPIKLYLHRKCAEEFEKMGVSPGIIAEHWLSAGEEERAVPLLVKAAEIAQDNFRLTDAANICEHVAGILELKNQPDEAFRYLGFAIQKLVGSGSYEQHERIIQTMFRLAHTSEQLAASFHVRSEYFANKKQDALSAEADAREGLKHAETPKIQSFLYGDLGVALWQQDRLAEAVEPMREAVRLQKKHNLEHLATSLANLSIVQQYLGHYRDALEVQQQAIELLRQQKSDQLTTNLSNYAITLSELGHIRQALEPLLEALELQRKTQGVDLQLALTLITLGQAQRDLCQFTDALASVNEAVELSEQASDSRISYFLANKAHLYLLLGHPRAARHLLDKAKNSGANIPVLQATVSREEGRWFIYANQKDNALMSLDAAKQHLMGGKRQLTIDSIDLLRTYAT